MEIKTDVEIVTNWQTNNVNAQKWVSLESLKKVQESCGKAVDEHRKQDKLTCPEDCWCWDLEGFESLA